MDASSWQDQPQPSYGRRQFDAESPVITGNNVGTESIHDWRAYVYEEIEGNRGNTIKRALYTPAAPMIFRRIGLTTKHLELIRDMFEAQQIGRWQYDNVVGKHYINVVNSIVSFMNHNASFVAKVLDKPRQDRINEIKTSGVRFVMLPIPPSNMPLPQLENPFMIMNALQPWQYIVSTRVQYVPVTATWRRASDLSGAQAPAAAAHVVVMQGAISTDLSLHAEKSSIDLVFQSAFTYTKYYNGQNEIGPLDIFKESVMNGVVMIVTFSAPMSSIEYIVQPVMASQDVFHMHGSPRVLLTANRQNDVVDFEVSHVNSVPFVVDTTNDVSELPKVDERINRAYTFFANFNREDANRSAAFFSRDRGTLFNAQLAFHGSWMLNKLSEIIATMVGLRYAAQRSREKSIKMSSILHEENGFVYFGHMYFRVNLTSIFRSTTDTPIDVIYKAQNIIAIYFILSMFVVGIPPFECLNGIYSSSPVRVGNPVKWKNSVHLGSTYIPDAHAIANIIIRASYNFFAVLSPADFQTYVETYTEFCESMIQQP